MADIGPWDTDENLRSDVYALQTDMTAAESDIDDLETAVGDVAPAAIAADTDEPTGFVYAEPDTLPVTLTFDNGTNTLTVAPSVSSFSFYVEGVKYTKSSSETIQIDDTVEGLHHIYYDADGALQEMTTFSEDLIMKYPYVAAIYWDVTNSKQISLGYECHGCKMDGHTHEMLHETFGSQIESGGGGLGGISSNDNSPDADSTKFTITQTAFWDEDIKMTHNAKGADDNIAIYYKSGADASNIWRVYESAANLCMLTGNGGGEDRAAYNQNNGGTWQLTEVTDNDYVLAHVFAFNDRDRGFGIFLGQNEYATVLAAREGASTELLSLDLRGFLTQELKILATVIIQTKDTWTGNAIRSRVVTTDGGEDFIDWRNSPLPQGGTSSTVTDHGALAGLDDTDHPASAIFTSTTNFSGLLSAADTTVQAALDTLDDLVQDAITSGSASATITADGLDITDGTDTVSINLDSGDVKIYNDKNGGKIYLQADNVVPSTTTMFVGDPSGAAELYYAGVKKLETTAAGISITDGTSTLDAYYNSTTFYLYNYAHGGAIQLYGENESGTGKVLINADPDGGVDLYYDGTVILSTKSIGGQYGIGINHQTDGSVLDIYGDTNQVVIMGRVHGDPVTIWGENAASGDAKQLFGGDPDGAAELYYAGNKKAYTGGYGIISTDGTWTLSVIASSPCQLIGSANGIGVYATNSGSKKILYGVANGAAELYYADVKKLETISGGIEVGDATSAGMEMYYDTGVFYFDSTQHAGLVYHRIEDTNGTLRNMIALNPNGADTYVGLYAGTGVLVLKTHDNGSAGGIKLGRNSDLGNIDVNSGNGDMRIQNLYDGGDIYITGEVATDTEKTMAKFAPDGAAELYNAGVKTLSTASEKIQIWDAEGANSIDIYKSGAGWIINHTEHGGALFIQGENASGAVKTLFQADPDNITYLYYAGVISFETRDKGIKIIDGATSYDSDIYMNSTSLQITNNEASGTMNFSGIKSGPTAVTLANFNPDGAVSLYYAGTATLATTAAGISITDGTATAATIGFSSDDLIIKNNDAGGHVYVQDSGGVNMIAALTGGAVTLKHNGQTSFSTHAEGVTIYDPSNSGAGLMNIWGNSSGVFFQGIQHAGNINFTVEDTGGTQRNILSFDPEMNTASNGLFGIRPDDGMLIYWDDAPANDLSGTGDAFRGAVDQNTVGIGGLLAMEHDAGADFYDADKDAATTCGHLAIALESSTGNKMLLKRGYFRNDAWSWTPGTQLFVGDSGAITDDVSGYTSGDIIQVVGYAHSSTVIYFDPSPTYDEVA